MRKDWEPQEPPRTIGKPRVKNDSSSKTALDPKKDPDHALGQDPKSDGGRQPNGRGQRPNLHGEPALPSVVSPKKQESPLLPALVIGGLAGLANGFFGSGGGLFLVPLFTRWIHLEQRKAFASSIAVILPLSLVSAVVYFFHGSIDLGEALPFLLGGLLGGILSLRFFEKIPLPILRKCFGVLIVYGGIRALFFP